MFDTMTVTKVVGALCGTLLFFLLGNWAADLIYHTGEHGEVEQAYVIDTGEGGEAEEASDAPEVPFEEVLAAADPSAGERIWRQCSSCHKLDGTNGTGPHLDGVVGRDIAGIGDFNYSDALASLEGDWTPEHLSGFLENPRDYAPGTKMTYKGLSDVEDRASIIAYLQTTGAS
jgi:cytochrome c